MFFCENRQTDSILRDMFKKVMRNGLRPESPGWVKILAIASSYRCDGLNFDYTHK